VRSRRISLKQQHPCDVLTDRSAFPCRVDKSVPLRNRAISSRECAAASSDTSLKRQVRQIYLRVVANGGQVCSTAHITHELCKTNNVDFATNVSQGF